MDAIRKYFWLYVAFVFLMIVGFHACVQAIDEESKQYQDKIERHLAGTNANYATERITNASR